MHVTRMVGMGRGSELFGPKFIPVDKSTIIMDIPNVARKATQNVDKDSLKILEAYCQGINDSVDDMFVLPIEF